VNFGIQGNVGGLYHLKSMSYFLEAGGNYGFINLQKENVNGTNYTGALLFRMGILWDFNTKK